MGLFTSWTKKDEEEFRRSELKKARKLARAEGREEGQELLVTTIQRLKNGETPEAIKKSGVDKKTIKLAMTCR